MADQETVNEHEVEILDRNVNADTARCEQWLVKRGDDYFVVSGVDAPFSGWEVLAFPADKDGNVTDWCEVAGSRGNVTHEDIVRELAQGDS